MLKSRKPYFLGTCLNCKDLQTRNGNCFNDSFFTVIKKHKKKKMLYLYQVKDFETEMKEVEETKIDFIQ